MSLLGEMLVEIELLQRSMLEHFDSIVDLFKGLIILGHFTHLFLQSPFIIGSLGLDLPQTGIPRFPIHPDLHRMVLDVMTRIPMLLSQRPATLCRMILTQIFVTVQIIVTLA
jgi:hypothetical protein